MADSNRKKQSTPKSTGKSTKGAGTSKRSGSGAKKSQGKSAKAEQDMGFLRAEVVIICSFAVAVLLFLSNFRLCGVVGEALRRAQLGVFGIVGFLVPILLFVGTCFHMSNEGNIHAALKLGAVILAIITVCGLFQLLFGSVPEGAKWMEYYAQSAETGRGGGWLGGVLSSLLVVALGRAGAYLVLFVVLIICMVCITERSFVSVVRSGGDKAYQYAREDMERRREEHQRRLEERRAREEQRVRGVNLDATKLSDPADLPDILEGQEEEPELPGDGGRAQAAPAAAAADVFQGRINLPPEYDSDDVPPEEDDVAMLADAIEKHQRGRGQTGGGAHGAVPDGTHGAVSGGAHGAVPGGAYGAVSGSAYGAVPGAVSGGGQASAAGGRAGSASARKEPADSYMLHMEDGEEMIRLPRDHRTLREMEFVEDDSYGPDGVPGAAAAGGALYGADGVDEAQGSDEDGAGYAGEAAFGHPAAASAAPHQGEAASGVDPDEPPFEEDVPDAQILRRAHGDGYGAAGYDAAGYGGGTYGEETYDDGGAYDGDTYDAPHSHEEGSLSVQEDLYPVDESAQGVNYDSVFVPEEPKRVVTASGKVIETETELLQKKLERKKTETAKKSESAPAVEEIHVEEPVVEKEYEFPPTTLLKRGVRNVGAFSQNEYKATAIKLQQTLRNFGVGVTVTNISCGPAVTRYELLPEQGVKVSKIVSLTDDIKLNLAAADIRIEAPIPGKSAVGIEVPNKENNVVYLRELLESDSFKNHKSQLAFAVGKDIGGQVVVTDIGKMPHLLIAGATGSGKSVCINTLIMSIIFKAKPQDVKLIMVDPKVVELSVYNGIPHLLIPVVTDPKKASGALNWAVAEMEDRYKKFAACNVRDLKGYNDRVEKIQDVEGENKPQKLPQIVIIIDELADLMMVAPGEVEESICRLAQLARAAGIHLVIATQRPSVNVITGLIKANVPSRIAFSVSSGVDSRTIIDMNGAEKLLGKGDMLFYPAGFPKPQRVQGAFVSDEEVGRVVEFLTEQGLTAQYSPDVESRIASPAAESGSARADDGRDEYFVQAGQLITDKEKASIGMLQRMFKIGFNRAARIMDQLAEAGVVGEDEGTKPRKVLMSPEEFQAFLEQGK